MEKLVPELRFSEFQEEFNSCLLGECSDISKLAGFEFTKHIIYSEVGSIIALRALNVKNRKISLDDVKYIDNSNLGMLSRSKLYVGDILLTYIGAYIGDAAMVEENDRFYLAPNICRIRTSEAVDPIFLFQYISSPIFYEKEILKHISTTSQPSLTMGNIRQLNVFYPPSLPEQTKIAEFLTAIDKRIELLTAKKEKLTLYKKGVMQKIFNQEIRFKPDESGEFPEWEEKRLGDVLIKYSEKSTSNNQFPVLTSARTGIHFQKDYFNGNDVASKDNTGYNVVPRGYFTYRHMSDDTSFKFNINTLCDKGIVSTLYPVFTTDGQDDYFIKAILNDGRDFENFAIMQKQGGSRTYMYFSKLEELLLFLPSLREQIKIAQFAQQLDSQIEVLTKQITLNQSYKKGLLQQMFV